MIREDPKLHRKQWEYAYILCALEGAGVLRQGKRGVAFGVGREPLVAAIASLGCSVVATDLPPQSDGAQVWCATGEYGGGVAALNTRGICAKQSFEDLVTFNFLDMRDLSDISSSFGSFDFLWSSCALEHLGSLQQGLTFVRESLNLLKPGGVAVHTTEYNVSSNDRTVTEGPVVLYRRRDLEGLARDLTACGHTLKLDFNTGREPEDLQVDIPPYRDSPHLKVLYGAFATTSFGVLVTKSL